MNEDSVEVNSPITVAGIEFDSIIGEGSFGEVWRAVEVETGRTVAVRVSRSKLSSENKKTFEQECRMTQSVAKHPGISDLISWAVEPGGRAYLASEFAENGTLADLAPELTEADLIEVGIEICDAIAAAHREKVFHRNLKPSNVFVRDSGQIAVGDFRLAKLYANEEIPPRYITETAAFAAPEILNGESATEASDVYGVAITLASAVLGRSPFMAEDEVGLVEVVRRVLTEPPADIASTSLSPELVAILQEALAKEPDSRPTTILKFKEALKGVLAGDSKRSPLADTVEEDKVATVEMPMPGDLPESDTQSARSMTEDAASPHELSSQTEEHKPQGSHRAASWGRNDHVESKMSRRIGFLAAGALTSLALVAVALVALQLDRSEDDEQRVRVVTTLQPPDSTGAPSSVVEAPSGRLVDGDPVAIVPSPVVSDEASAKPSETTKPARSTTTTSVTATTTVPAPSPPTVTRGQPVKLNFGEQVDTVRQQANLQPGDTQRYLVDGSAGQRLSISYVSRLGEGDARFSISDPSGETLIRGRSKPSSIVLTSSGTFVIDVVLRNPQETSYEMQISLRDS